MYNDKCKGAQQQNNQGLLRIIRNWTRLLVGYGRHKCLIGAFVTFIAGCDFIFAEDRRIRICFCQDVMRVVAAGADRHLRMSQVELAAVEAFGEALHDIFLQIILFDNFFVSMAFSAGFDLVFAAHLSLGVLGLEDVMSGPVAVDAERAIRLVFLEDIFAMDTAHDLFEDFLVARLAGRDSDSVYSIFCRKLLSHGGDRRWDGSCRGCMGVVRKPDMAVGAGEYSVDRRLKAVCINVQIDECSRGCLHSSFHRAMAGKAAFVFRRSNI